MRCEVDVCGPGGRWSAIARAADAEGVNLHWRTSDAANLRLGAVLELSAQAPPLGPLRVLGHITWIHSAADARGNPVRCVRVTFTQMDESVRAELDSRLRSSPTLVLTLGLDQPLTAVPGDLTRIVEVRGVEDILGHLDAEEAAVLVVGSRLAPIEVHRVLSRVIAAFPRATENIVLGVQATDALQPLVDQDQLFYVSPRALTNWQLGRLIAAAVVRLRAMSVDTLDATLTSERLLESFARICRQKDVVGLGRVLTGAVQHLVGAECIQCLTYDRERDVLRVMDGAGAEPGGLSAASGLVGYVVRTGTGVVLETISVDPRYEPDADNPSGNGASRFMAEPLLGSGRSPLGIVTALRSERTAPFSSHEIRIFEALARAAGATLSGLVVKAHVDALLDRALVVRGSSIFRAEALEHHSGATARPGELLEATPAWLKVTPWIVLIVLCATIGLLMVGQVNEYAFGPAVIRARKRTSVTAPAAGVVRSVSVWPGDRVLQGAAIARIDPVSSAHTQSNGPGDLLSAPIRGLVADVLVQPPREVSAGETIAEIVDEGAGYELVVVLPGSYAHRVTRGMRFALRLSGYPPLNEALVIDYVGAPIGAEEAARFSRGGKPESAAVHGPVILVRCKLPSTFVAGDAVHAYLDGMTGDAQMIVGSQPILAFMMPGLRQFASRLNR